MYQIFVVKKKVMRIVNLSSLLGCEVAVPYQRRLVGCAHIREISFLLDDLFLEYDNVTTIVLPI